MDWESKIVFRSPRLRIGQFRCRRESSLWTSENLSGDLPLVVFPRRAVTIHQSEHRAVVANPNNVMFYDANQPYRRCLVDPRGDKCEFFAVAPEILEEALGHANFVSADSPSRLFATAHAGCSARNYLAQRALFSWVQSQPDAESLFVEEAFLRILNRVLVDAAKFHWRPETKLMPRSIRRNRDKVEGAKEYIALHFREPITLEEIATAVDCSVFHLCRQFKSHTGVSIHKYLSHFRLRTSIESVHERTNAKLTQIALDLAFSSHSHFTNSFRQQFGLSPKALRESLPVQLLTQIQDGSLPIPN